MTPEEWAKLQAAFEKALSIDDGAARAAYVAGLHADDPAFAAEVQRMLDADVTSDDDLVSPVHAMAAKISESETDRWIGVTLGNYRITRKIAVGGMSAVYLAERADKQFDQEVAVKIVGGQLLSDDLKTRFRTERQILASLKHPNIAQLFDGGATEDGVPYLVMEYIDGLPIDQYCDLNTLGIEERLRLFMKVCDAIEYAHRNLVVHRDIKPSNILVTQDGTPKLLDFGIAKPLQKAELNQTIAVTHASSRAMTPEYASPEQVRGETITTATDVYSLGVLLYKLLSGRMPYLLMDRGMDSFVRAILETQPSKPSTVITLADEENDRSPAIVAQRRQSIGGLKKLLAGDLDTITLATLQKEPERRYPSARALRDDIARYLANEPVSAQPDSLGYRTRKFISRHRVGVMSSVAVTAAAVGLVSFYTWQLTIERNRAEAEATKATQVVDFLSGVFRSASPYDNRGDDLTVRELLSRGVTQLETDLADQPEVLAELLNRLAVIHQDLALYEEAAQLQARALNIARATFDADDPRVAAVLLNMASASREAFALEEAMAYAEEALAIAERAVPPEPRWVAAAWNSIGSTWSDMEQHGEAVAAQRKALEIYRELGQAWAENIAMTTHDLANSLLMLEGGASALPVAVDAYEQELAIYGDAHPALAKSLSLQAVIHYQLGNIDESERLYREALTMKEGLFGREHPEVGTALNRLANLLSSRQRWGDVEPLLDEALAILEAHFPPEHYWVATTRGMLAEVYSETGRTEQALALAEEWLQVSRQQFGDESWTAAIAFAEYADALLEAYRDEEAIRAFQQSVAAFELNNGGLATDYTRAKLGRALLLDGRTDDASRSVSQALSDARSRMMPENAMVARVLVAYGEVSVARGDFSAARDAADEAIEIITAGDQVGNTWYWLARTVIAGAMLGQGNSAAARAELESIIAGLARENGTRSRAEDAARTLRDTIETAP